VVLTQGKETYTFKLDENGQFSDTIYDFEDGYFTFSVGNEYTNMYLKDGFNVFVEIDVIDFDESIQYEGIGAHENNLLAKNYLNEELFDPWHLCALSEDSFLIKIDSFTAHKQAFLAEYATLIPELDAQFKQFENLNYTYFGAFIKENYQSTHRYYTQNDSFEVSKDFYKYRKALTIENKDYLKIAYYPSFVMQYIANQIPKNDTAEYAFSELRAINKSIQNNELKKEFIYNSAKNNLTEVKKIEEYWALVSYMVTDKSKLSELKKTYKKINKLKTGNASPLTGFINLSDKTAHLSDNKGKYIYIDCWAQWCGPCKQELPYLQQLEKKYATKNIVFLKLSLDEDVNAWKKYAEENNITQHSFRLENAFDSNFAQEYIIQSIPRFILLDTALNIIDAKALRPSNSQLETQLNALLN
jgi:thiol-disulfide isomerase/thioredoxin